MARVKLLSEEHVTGTVKEIYEDIKRTFGLPFVPNLFKAMAVHPAYLRTTWDRFKVIMGPGKLDPKTKEFLALAVSTVNNCEYCINAHTAQLRRMGVSEEELVEGLAVVDLFCGINKFLDGLRVESDLK
ncbi:MAG: carboxymuconolactone decarboxylase family protein [Acidobacteria bacterium]|nr:MAG: carboxymuconolactone decarboxylase family protein [Acidobacteriota bacterium]